MAYDWSTFDPKKNLPYLSDPNLTMDQKNAWLAGNPGYQWNSYNPPTMNVSEGSAMPAKTFTTPKSTATRGFASAEEMGTDAMNTNLNRYLSPYSTSRTVSQDYWPYGGGWWNAPPAQGSAWGTYGGQQKPDMQSLLDMINGMVSGNKYNNAGAYTSWATPGTVAGSSGGGRMGGTTPNIPTGAGTGIPTGTPGTGRTGGGGLARGIGTAASLALPLLSSVGGGSGSFGNLNEGLQQFLNTANTSLTPYMQNVGNINPYQQQMSDLYGLLTGNQPPNYGQQVWGNLQGINQAAGGIGASGQNAVQGIQDLWNNIYTNGLPNQNLIQGMVPGQLQTGQQLGGTVQDWINNVYTNGIPGQTQLQNMLPAQSQQYNTLMGGQPGQYGAQDLLSQTMRQGLPGQRTAEGTTTQMGDVSKKLLGTQGAPGAVDVINQITLRGLPGQKTIEDLIAPSTAAGQGYISQAGNIAGAATTPNAQVDQTIGKLLGGGYQMAAPKEIAAGTVQDPTGQVRDVATELAGRQYNAPLLGQYGTASEQPAINLQNLGGNTYGLRPDVQMAQNPSYYNQLVNRAMNVGSNLSAPTVGTQDVTATNAIAPYIGTAPGMSAAQIAGPNAVNASSLQNTTASQLQNLIGGGGLSPEYIKAARELYLQPQMESLQGRLNAQGGGTALPGSPLFQELERRNERDFMNQLLLQGGNNLTNYLSQGAALGGQQFQQGMENVKALQAAREYNASNAQQAAAANQAAQQAYGLEGYRGNLQTALGNAAAANRASELNASNLLSANLANQNAALRTQDLGVNAALQGMGYLRDLSSQDINRQLANQELGLSQFGKGLEAQKTGLGAIGQGAGLQQQTQQQNIDNAIRVGAANQAAQQEANRLGLQANQSGAGLLGNVAGIQTNIGGTNVDNALRAALANQSGQLTTGTTNLDAALRGANMGLTGANTLTGTNLNAAGLLGNLGQNATNTGLNAFTGVASAAQPYINMGLTGGLNAGQNVYQGVNTVGNAAFPYVNLAGNLGQQGFTNTLQGMGGISNAAYPWAGLGNTASNQAYDRALSGFNAVPNAVYPFANLSGNLGAGSQQLGLQGMLSGTNQMGTYANQNIGNISNLLNQANQYQTGQQSQQSDLARTILNGMFGNNASQAAMSAADRQLIGQLAGAGISNLPAIIDALKKLIP